jgi:heptosyltransferase-2
MKKCALIITNDAGPMHIASAVNDKIISIFGPTNPVRKAPLNEGSVSIWKDQDIYEEDYELYGKLPKKKKWMTKITAKDVEEKAREILR